MSHLLSHIPNLLEDSLSKALLPLAWQMIPLAVRYSLLAGCVLNSKYKEEAFLDSSGAVSYTHLDVYKRQGFSRAEQSVFEGKQCWSPSSARESL